MALALVTVTMMRKVPMKDRDYEIKALDITDEVKKPEDAGIETKEAEDERDNH